jgi:hypothetical protein
VSRVAGHASSVVLQLQCSAALRGFYERAGYAVVQASSSGGSSSTFTMRKCLQSSSIAAPPSCLATAALATTWCGNRFDYGPSTTRKPQPRTVTRAAPHDPLQQPSIRHIVLPLHPSTVPPPAGTSAVATPTCASGAPVTTDVRCYRFVGVDRVSVGVGGNNDAALCFNPTRALLHLFTHDVSKWAAACSLPASTAVSSNPQRLPAFAPLSHCAQAPCHFTRCLALWSSSGGCSSIMRS